MKVTLIVSFSLLFELYSFAHRSNKAQVLKEQLRSIKTKKPFEHFKTFEEIENQLKRWAKTNSDLFTLGVIGHTYHKRNIYSLSIEAKLDDAKKPGVLIECGMHPREWISPAICFYLINQLLDEDSQASRLLASFNFYMIPMLNPDGYVYTWTNDRLWRKNRSPQSNGCVGVDLNRNFDIDFCEHGSDKDPCSLIFCGPKAFSELESQAFRDYATKLKNKKKLQHSFHIHSYGQQITYPYGYSADKESKEAKKLENIVKATAFKIEQKYGSVYKYGQSGKLIYEASGGSDDWTMSALGVQSVYCIENKDKGDYGFMLSNNQIRNASEECSDIIMNILRYFIDE